MTAPFVAAVPPRPDTLWPPKHQLVDVTVHGQRSDDSGETPACQLASITSSDADNGAGDGDTGGRLSSITGPFSAKLRAERSGGRERCYGLPVQCWTARETSAPEYGAVVVPKNGN